MSVVPKLLSMLNTWTSSSFYVVIQTRNNIASGKYDVIWYAHPWGKIIQTVETVIIKSHFRRGKR
jgi:hypothetical protein